MRMPNAETHDTRLWFVRSLVERAQERRGLSQSALAERIGISRRRLQYIMAGGAYRNGKEGRYYVSVSWTYLEQYALEALAQ